MLTTILNPKSGSAGDNFRERVENALREAGAEYEILETTKEISGKDLACKAVKNGARHLLACGGDGTVMSVVNGIGQSGLATAQDQPQITLSIIPGGTANLLAGALKIPDEVDEAVEVAVNGRDLALDLGLSGEHWFALGMGLGLTEKLVSQTSTKEKEVLGKLAYARAMLSELGMKPHHFTLKLDEKPPLRQAGVALVVANAGEIGGGLKFAPDAKMDDGMFQSLSRCAAVRGFALGFHVSGRAAARRLRPKIQRKNLARRAFGRAALRISTKPNRHSHRRIGAAGAGSAASVAALASRLQSKRVVGA
jgi:YegS/Rv2252/BmrU family lipid kinase